MKDGWYIACPACLELSKGEGWIASYKERHNYSIEIRDTDKMPEVGYYEQEVVDTVLDYLKHRCGYITEKWIPIDLMVKIEDNKIVDMGDYWYEAPLTELTKLMQKNGLTLDKERVLR